MLDEPQVRQLLAIVMAYDNRKPGDATVLAWSEAARRGRWTYAEAAEAIHAHYATETTWLMPGHITQRIKATRPVHTMSESGAGPAPDRLGQRRVAEIVGGGFRDVDEDPHPAAAPGQRDRELTVACPHCEAAPGIRCSRPGKIARQYLVGYHPARREAAAS